MIKPLFNLIVLTLSFISCQAQTWQSFNYAQFSNTIPYGQFIINQYNNDIWMVNDNKVAIIENSGDLQLFDYNELGTLWTGDHLRFTFTPDSIFYMKETIGLFNFNNYISSTIYSEPNILEITSNVDTVYIIRSGSILQYINGQILDTYYSASDIIAKNSFLYSDNGILGHNVGFSNEMLLSDPQYLLANINDKKFQRHNDTLYVGTTKGIMFAYDYDILDTITPNNSMNMPSANVLEIEFDDKDSLWAVFGDIDDVPFAIAKLENMTWTNLINSSNSPINFSLFEGLEIDTLGNLWVADQISLHTLLTPNSPGWLGTNELNDESNLSVFPNPSKNTFKIQNSTIIDFIQIIDLQGRLIRNIEVKSENFMLDLSEIETGQYFLNVHSNNTIQRRSLIKE